MIDAPIWPSTAARGADGVLVVGGCRVDDLAERFGTPLFVLDEADFRARAAAWRAAFPGGDVHYAAKAFLCGAVARWAVAEGLHLDVCSGGELALALRAGVPGDRILLHGNNKSAEELTAAVDAGVHRVVVDAAEEIDRLARIAVDRGTSQPIYLRITPGVHADTHAFVATGQEDSKFGFALETGEALAAALTAGRTPGLRLLGLHCHIGSQIFDPAGWQEAATRMVDLLADLCAAGVPLDELDLGGGPGIAYHAGDDPVPPAAFAAALTDAVEAACARRVLPVPRIAVEPGRALVGPAMVTVYRVGVVKDRPGIRTYVAVDGGMSDNIRTALYDASYTATLASRTSTAPTRLCRVVGKHCESGDVVVRDADLPADLAAGDLLAVAATGAYGRSMASNYNLVPRPPVVAVRDGRATLVVRRETVDDLLGLDIGLDLGLDEVL